MIIILFLGVLIGGLQTFIDWNIVRFLAFDVRKLFVYVPVAILNFVFSLIPGLNIITSITFYLI